VNWWQWVRGLCRVDSAALPNEFNDSIGFEVMGGWSHSQERSGGCRIMRTEVLEVTYNGLEWASNLVTREAVSDNFSMYCILLV
jgi:hypothetical protein